VLPELDHRLSAAARRTLTGRGVEVRTGTTVTEVTGEGVRLSTGELVATRSLVWCVGGCAPDPLVTQLGLPTAGAGWSSTSTWPCPATRRCWPAATWRRSPT
jgi:NADH:ubiquinone reductase (H+-translocating)